MKEFELERGEHVIKQVRKHWFLFLIELLPYAILALLPFSLPALLSFIPAITNYGINIDFSAPIGRALLGIWLLLVWTVAWGAFTKYFLNVWVLTNSRIVDIEQVNFFNREVSSLFLNRVQDVTTTINGIIPSLLDIGDINVQSAGAVNEFHMRGIPIPNRMRDLILKYVPENDGNGT